MSIQAEVLFDGDGKPTYILISQVHRKTPHKALQADVTALEQDGTATKDFRSWWSAAFPTRKRLPAEPIADANGVGTLDFWKVFT